MINPNLQRATMPQNVVILHGKPLEARYRDENEPKPHEAGWIGWAATRFSLLGYDVTVPAIREPYKARYADWVEALDGKPVGKQTTMVGYSYGANVLRWLTERPGMHIGHLALVAPWLDPKGKYPEAGVDFEIDPTLQERVERGIDIFYDADDGWPALETIRRLRGELPDSEQVRYHELPGYGHFLIGNTMLSPEFPELLQAVGTPR